MNEKMYEIAANTMKVSLEDAKRHCKVLEDICAYYFWNPMRGGISVIVNDSGEKLAAASAVSFERLKAAFVAGKRN